MIQPAIHNKTDHTQLLITQSAAPSTVGIATATAVHLRLPVSFFIVRQVVDQGQWNRQKIAMESAVFTVQPWAASRLNSAAWSSISTSTPVWR